MPPKRRKVSSPTVGSYHRGEELEKKLTRMKEKNRALKGEVEELEEILNEAEALSRNLGHSVDSLLELINRMRTEAHRTDYTSVEDFVFDHIPEEMRYCQKCGTLLNPFKPEISCSVCSTPFW